MPTPTSSTTIQRPDLGIAAYETWIEKQQSEFIGLRLAPVFESALQTSTYTKIPIEALLKQQDTKRASRSGYNRSDWNFENGHFSCEENGWEELLPEREVKKYRYLIDAEMVSVKRAVHIILMNHEIRVAAIAQSTSLWSKTDVSTEWTTAATATPHKDVTITGWNAFKALAGVTPNVGACSDTVFRTLVNTDEVKDALQYTDPIQLGGKEAQRRAMAMYFGLEELLIGGGSKSTAKKGQSAVPTDIWDDEYFGLYRVEQSMDLEAPQAMRTFMWTEDSDGILTTEQYREEQTRSEVYRVRHDTDEVQIFSGAGYLLGNISA